MNDYLLRSMMRQRHEQILTEVNLSRTLPTDRPQLDCGLMEKIRMVWSSFRLWFKPAAHR